MCLLLGNVNKRLSRNATINRQINYIVSLAFLRSDIKGYQAFSIYAP